MAINAFSILFLLILVCLSFKDFRFFISFSAFLLKRFFLSFVLMTFSLAQKRRAPLCQYKEKINRKNFVYLSVLC